MTIQATTLFDDKTVAVAYAYHLRKAGLRGWLWTVAGVLLIVAAISRFEQPGWLAFNILSVVAGTGFLLRKWLFGLISRRRLRASPFHGKPINWRIEPHALSGETEGANWTFAWDKFHETFATPDGLLLYPYKNAYYWLPKKAFASEEDYEEARRIIATATKHRELK